MYLRALKVRTTGYSQSWLGMRLPAREAELEQVAGSPEQM